MANSEASVIKQIKVWNHVAILLALGREEKKIYFKNPDDMSTY